MPEVDPYIEGFEAEREVLQRLKDEVNQNTSMNPAARQRALEELAAREIKHIARVQEYVQNQQDIQSIQTAASAPVTGTPEQIRAQGRETAEAAVPGFAAHARATRELNAIAQARAALAEAGDRVPESERTRITQELDAREQSARGNVLPSKDDPRGTVDATTVAGTPARGRRRPAAPAPAPEEPPPKGAPYVDPYDPNTLYDYEGPISEIRRSFLEQGKIEQQAGLDSAAMVMAAAEEVKAQREAAYQQMRENLLSQEQQLRELDVQLASLREMEFDSDRLFRNGHGVSLALGMAVGAMQQTLSNVLFPGANAPNTAMQLVQDAIDRDLREQSVNYQRGVTNLGMARTSYEMARQLGMDHIAAYEYASATAQDYVARQLNARRLTMGAGVAAQQATRAEQELRMRAMEGKERALMALAQLRAQQIGAGGRGGRGAGAAAGGVDERIIAPMTRLRAGYSIRDLRKDMGPALDRLTQTMTGASEVMRIVDRLRTLVQRTGGGQNWATRVGGEIRSLAAQLKDAIRQASGMGALDNGALAMTEQIAGDPVSFTESMSTFLGRLQALRQVTFTRAKEHVRTIGQGRLEFDEREREAGFSGIPEDPDFEDLGDQPGEEDTFTGQFSTSAGAIGRAVMREPGAASLSASPFGILSRSETFRNFVSSILSEDEQ
jgi:hypothetical protein